MRFAAVLLVLAFLMFALDRAVAYELDPPAQAHLVRVPDKPSRSFLESRAASQRENLAHSAYVCRHGARANQRWHCAAKVWIRRELNETLNLLRPQTDPTVANMVAAAEGVKAASPGSDPWPNCPDPYDGGGYSWQDTKDCESPGYSWYEDPPGYYCGPLQLDPVIWAHLIRRYGVPC